MPRHCQAHVPGALYHITLRGAYRSEHYFALDDRDSLIEVLREMLERFAGKLHCYDNSRDRLRLLVQVGEEPLGRMMLRVARRYLQCVQERLGNGRAASLPEALEVVNRLFEMRVRPVAHGALPAHRQPRSGMERGCNVDSEPNPPHTYGDTARRTI
jgi:REP element-mobilizing transposase RayT